MRFHSWKQLVFVASLSLVVGGQVACEKNFREPASGGGTTSTGASTSAGSGDSGGSLGAGGALSGGGAGAVFGISRCDAGDFLLCDGFEAGSIDSGKWSIEKAGSNVVELTTSEAARGAQSVHIHTQTDKFAFLKTTKIFPLSANDYYGRMFVRVARYSKVDWAHWTLAEATGSGDGSLIRVGGQYRTDLGKNRFGIGSDGGPTGDWTTHDEDPDGVPGEPPIEAWSCIEWAHLGSTNETHFYLDGVEHTSLGTTSTIHGGKAVPYVLPKFESVWVGWYQYQSDPEAFDVWIDEVALDDERIGCER